LDQLPFGAQKMQREGLLPMKPRVVPREEAATRAAPATDRAKRAASSRP